MTEPWAGGSGQPLYPFQHSQQPYVPQPAQGQAPGYGPPGGPIPPGQWPGAAPKPVKTLGRWTAGMLTAAAAVQATGGVVMLLHVELAAMAVLGVSSLVMLACVVLVMIWLHQVRSNIEHLDPYQWAGRRRLSRGWAVGSWFVPVGFLWLPLQVVLDVWWGSAEPTQERRRTPKIIIGWWVCWLLSWFTGVRFTTTVSHAAGASFESHSVNVFPGATALSALFAVAAGLLLGVLVRKVTAVQTARLNGADNLHR